MHSNDLHANHVNTSKKTVPTGKVITLADFGDAHHGDTSSLGAGKMLISPKSPAHPIHSVKTMLQVSVGTATLSVGELLAARENQVLRLDRAVDQAVDLMLEGQVVARGQLVAVDGHFAVRITELPQLFGAESSAAEPAGR